MNKLNVSQIKKFIEHNDDKLLEHISGSIKAKNDVNTYYYIRGKCKTTHQTIDAIFYANYASLDKGLVFESTVFECKDLGLSFSFKDYLEAKAEISKKIKEKTESDIKSIFNLTSGSGVYHFNF